MHCHRNSERVGRGRDAIASIVIADVAADVETRPVVDGDGDDGRGLAIVRAGRSAANAGAAWVTRPAAAIKNFFINTLQGLFMCRSIGASAGLPAWRGRWRVNPTGSEETLSPAPRSRPETNPGYHPARSNNEVRSCGTSSSV